MATLTKGQTFAGAETVTATKLNNLVDNATIANIVNADIGAGAAIALSKLATGALPTGITVASANIVDGTIVNADINASAAIALSKLATGALPTAITVASANIVDGTIVNADVSASAAIAGTKVAPDFGSQNVVTTGTLRAGPSSAPLTLGTNGKLYVGHSGFASPLDSPLSVAYGAGAGIGIQRYTNNAIGGSLRFFKSRSDTIGGNASVSSGDTIGAVNFWAANGTSYNLAASISCSVDGTPGVDEMPGRLTLNTTADGASTPTERMRITNAGNIGIGTNAPNAAAQLDIASTTRGFLPPRMTTAERDAISTPPAGLMVYNTTTNKLNFYNGAAWEAVTSA